MPSAAGVRHALNAQVDRAIGSRHAEVIYLTSLFVTGCVSGALLWAARKLSRDD